MTICSGYDCDKEAGNLMCPICLEMGIRDSNFCDQECFRRNWLNHKALHHDLAQNSINNYNPFPKEAYTGRLRAVYPLRPQKTVADPNIDKPEYVHDSFPYGELIVNRSNFMKILSSAEIAKMRQVNTIGREILDVAARLVKPGITTEEIDDVVFQTCMNKQCYPSLLNY